MKNIYRLSALACIAVVFNGCVEENLEPIKPAQNGDEIIFGARAGFEDSDPSTKTVYSGQTYESGGKTFERIDWLDDGSDKIEIYCQQAANGPSAHYTIHDASIADDDDNTTVDKKDEAVLTRIGDGALQWNGDGDHTFYAMYPSSMMFTNDPNKTVETGVFMNTSDNGAVFVNGIIPSSQQPVVEEVKDANGDGTGNYVAKPDMDFAYMVAKTTAIRKSVSVGLDFVPIVTAVEIELFNPATNTKTVNIGEIQVSSDESIIGSFSADLSNWSETYPTCTITSEPTAEANFIQITPRIDNNGTPVAVPIAPNKSLKFTVFLLPGATDKTIQDLTIGVSITGTNYKNKKLSGANIQQHLKTRISKINLPELAIEGDKWMEDLESTVSFKALSLPGTGGSFTSTANTNFRQQSLTFEEQWGLGIRAFEASSDRPSSGTTSLGGQSITCNKQAVTGVTVYSILTDLLDKVQSIRNDEGKLTETAALILTYQPSSNNPARDPAAYLQSLYTMLTGTTENCLTSDEYKNIIAYTPDLTMETARGKVILIVRPTQRDEDAAGILDDATVKTYIPADKLTAIDGCGTAKDKWGARGYQIKDQKKEWSQTYNDGLILDYWLSKVFSATTYTSAVQAYDISNYAKADEEHITQDVPNPEGGDIRYGYDIVDGYVELYMQDAQLFANGSTTNDVISYNNSYNNGLVTRPAANADETGGLNFDYTTNISGITCWFQEWARVVPAESAGNKTGTWRDPNNYWSSGNYNINWFESYSEKLSNVISTFDMAISGEYLNYVFINSLCGYLATTATNVTPTYSLVPSMPGGSGGLWGGAGGDIQGLANKLNPAFYAHVLNSGMEYTTGPTGIVLMDFVSNQETAGGAYYLPGAIIANNFKFD